MMWGRDVHTPGLEVGTFRFVQNKLWKMNMVPNCKTMIMIGP